jgi:hypothetical protein
MDLEEAMRTTFAAREFTADPVPDTTLVDILDRARFAPSGGNRQGWKVIVVRDPATKRALAELSAMAAKRYAAQVQNGENPWNTIDPPRVDAATIERTAPPARLTEALAKAPVLLVVCVDLKVVASTDQELKRIGIISGAGTITTLTVAQEPKVQALLGLPSHVAVCAVMPLGRPLKRLTKLKRKEVAEFAMLERWGGAPLRAR